MKEVQLKNDSIILRPYKSSDAAQIYSAVRESLPELLPWQAWCHEDYVIKESRSWIKFSKKSWHDETGYYFAITDAGDGSYLGSCGLDKINSIDKVANLGYWVRSSRTKKGIATGATLLLEEFGFRELKLNRIEILVAVENKASQRVAEEVGAVREGVLRNRLLLQGKVHDAVMFSLIPQ